MLNCLLIHKNILGTKHHCCIVVVAICSDMGASNFILKPLHISDHLLSMKSGS